MQLFENFLKDFDVYDQSVKYWEDLCQNIFKTHQKQEEWEQWFSHKFLNGEPIRNGNPISSWVNYKEKKGIRIIQESSGPEIPIIAYTSIFDPEVACIREIVISCFLTETTSEKAKKIIDVWTRIGQDFDKMETEINNIINEKIK